MAYFSNIDNKLKFIAVFLAFIQGIAWILMAAICIGLHNVKLLTSVNEINTHMDNAEAYWYYFFIKGVRQFPHQVLYPYAFHVFAWIFLILNTIWVAVSINVLLRRKSGVSVSLQVWSFFTCLICLWDFIVVIILGTDYNKCLDLVPFGELNTVLIGDICADTILPVLIIVAKGFVLWIINLISSFVLLNMARQIKQEENKNTHRFGPNFSNPNMMFSEPERHSPAPEPRPQPVQPSGYYPQQHQYPTSPTYNAPLQQPNYADHLNNQPSTTNSSPRRWNVYSPTPASRSNENEPQFHPQNNWRSQGQMLSDKSQQPFVLHNPPSRY